MNYQTFPFSLTNNKCEKLCDPLKTFPFHFLAKKIWGKCLEQTKEYKNRYKFVLINVLVLAFSQGKFNI